MVAKQCCRQNQLKNKTNKIGGKNLFENNKGFLWQTTTERGKSNRIRHFKEVNQHSVAAFHLKAFVDSGH